MNDYIRKAVELVPDEWPWDFFKANPDQTMDQPLKDALAAQLVRQVEAPTDHFVEQMTGWTAVREGSTYLTVGDKAASYGPDRTMNTIKAIVDSGVLRE